LWPDERVPTSAGIFNRVGSGFDNMDTMAQQPARVVNFFPEFVTGGIRIAS
jgi:hypothetical protein